MKKWLHDRVWMRPGGGGKNPRVPIFSDRREQGMGFQFYLAPYCWIAVGGSIFPFHLRLPFVSIMISDRI